MVDIKEQLQNAPYFDDYDPNDNYYRMLFRPRFAVQARELTQLQTMFQAQIERMGRHFFKEGSMVIPGICNFDTTYNYVKVYTNETIDNSAFFVDDVAIKNNFVGKIISSQVGVRARVVNYTNPDQNGIIRLYVKYLQAGSDTNAVAVKRFRSSEQLTVEGSGIVLETITDPDAVVGVGTGATIKDGVYFTNGFFAVVQQQAIVVEPESTTPTVSIGLDVNISIVTPEEDESLLDNAQGAPNYAAPGAHRLKIELVLNTRPVDRITTESVTDTQFIELVRLIDGFISEPANRTEYNILRDEMARRTFEESGHYAIKPFVTVVQEFLNNGENNGVYTLDMLKRPTSDAAEAVGQKLLGISGSHSYGDFYLPGASTEIFEAAARTKLVYRIDPGKAYVQGYEIEKLDRSIAIGRKAIDTISVSPAITKTMKGPYIRVTNIFGLPAMAWGEARESNNSFEEVLLFSRKRSFMNSENVPVAPGSTTLVTPGEKPDRTSASPYCIGKARAVYFDYSSGVPGTSSAEYLLHLIDIEITNPDYSIEHVQSFIQSSGSSVESTIGFEADAFQYTIPLLGATVSSASTSFRDQLEAKNAYWKTLDEQRVSPNDNLVAGSTAEGTIVYLYATAPALNNQSISIDKNASGVFTDLTVTKLYTVLEDQDAGIFLYPLANGKISTIDLESVDFVVQKLFVNDKVGSTITINLPTGEGIFNTYSQTEWFFVKETTGEMVIPTSVDFVTSTEASITFDGTVGDEKIVTVAAVRLNGQNQVTKRDKTLRQGIYQNTGTPSGQHYLLTSVNETNLQNIRLGVYDVIRIKAIYMSSDFVLAPTPNDIDIKDRYILDNGQRDTHYGEAILTLDRGAQPPTGRLAIVYDWFEHSPDGSYFCVDSYPIGPDFTIEDIPSYSSIEGGRTYYLGDVFDFRSTINVSTGNFRERIFYLPEADILAGFDHYLNRRDKLYITPQGEFRVLEGVSAINPVLPPDPVDGMVTAEINLPALTRDTRTIEIKHRNNRRYTMRDIGKIEDRIGQIEYYTSLSLLETNTEKLVIKDAQGNDRFKNGFMVDNFRGHATGDVQNVDYSCAVDPTLGILRPAFVERGVELVEVKPYENNLLGFTPISSETERTAANYTKKGDLLMLDYEVEEVPQMQQMFATSFINVNPFEVISFVGRGTLTPSSDEFKSTELLSDKIVDLDTGLTDALTELSTGLGTIYTFDSVNFDVQQSQEVFEMDAIASPPIPAPAWHVEEDGSLGVPNELATLLANRGKKKQQLNKKVKLKKKLKGELKAAKNKKEKKGIRNRLKAINNQIKELKPQVSLKNPPQPSFPRLYLGQERIVTNSSTTANGGKRISVKPKTIETNLGDSVKSINFAEYCRSQIIKFDLVGMQPNSRLYVFIDDLPLTHFAIPSTVAQTIFMPFSERNADTAFAGDATSPTSQIIFDPNPEVGINASNDNYAIKVDQTGTVSGYIYLPNGLPVLTPNGIEYLANSPFNPKIKTGEKTIRFTDSPQNIDRESNTSTNIKFNVRGLIEQKQNTILSTKSAEVATEFANESKVITETKETSYKLSYATWNDPIAETIIVEEPGGMFVTGVQIFFRRKPHRGSSSGADNGITNTTGTQSPIVPVSVEIRENVVGVPGPFTLPGSRIFLNPNQIVVNDILGDTDTPDNREIGTLRISIPNGDGANANDTSHAHYVYSSFGVDNSNMPSWDPKTRTLNASMPADGSDKVGMIGTYFEFDYPIYLQERTEYSIVVRSNCQDYECWYARIAEFIAGTTIPLTTTGAYNGVFLKSANSSTWTPDQQADLMFKMFRAQFPTDVTGEITFVNQDLTFDKLKNNPFKVEEGSNMIKVYHKNHGMRNRQSSEQKPRVKITGLSTDVGGIPFALINTEAEDSVNKWHDITVLDFDTYCFEVKDEFGKPVHATSTIYRTGGNTVFASSDVQVDELLTNITNINFDDTSVDYAYRICSGAGVHGGLYEPYVLPGTNEFTNFQSGQNVIFSEPKMIPGLANQGKWNYLDSGINGIMTTPGRAEGSSKGLFITATLSTDNPNVSPIIDLAKTSVLCIGNKVSDAGLVGEYKSFCEPNDLVFFGWTEVGTATAITNTEIADITPSSLTVADWFHVGGFIRIVDSIGKPFIAKISSVGATSVTFESPIGDVDDSGTVTVYTSGMPYFSFGDIPVTKASAVNLSVSGDTFSTDDAAVISDLVEVFEGTLIKITDTDTSNFVITRVISVIRTTSTDITVRTEADLATELSLTPGTYTFDIAVYDDVITIEGSGPTYDAARNLGKKFQNSMQEGQYIRVVNTTSNKNDAEYELVRIREEDDGSNYKLILEVDYDIDADESPSNVTVVGIEDFYSMESPQKGTSSCTYITKRMVLSNPCTSLKVKFLANVQENQNIGVFAKFSGLDTAEKFDEARYEEISPLNGRIPGFAQGPTVFHDYEFEEQFLAPFTEVAIKITLQGEDSTKPIRVQDLQIIALDS